LSKRQSFYPDPKYIKFIMPKAIILACEANRLIVKLYFLAEPQSTQSHTYIFYFACSAALRDYKIQND